MSANLFIFQECFDHILDFPIFIIELSNLSHFWHKDAVGIEPFVAARMLEHLIFKDDKPFNFGNIESQYVEFHMPPH